MSRIRHHRNSHGVTLVELVVSIVVIGVAVAGVLAVMVRNTQSSADPMVQHQATAIAEAYLEEILTKEFTDPDSTEVGETRPTFDDVDDYHNLANSGCLNTTAACPVLGSCACDQNGNPIDGLNGYTVNVVVVGEALNGIGAANAFRVTVTVTPPQGGDIVVSSYRTNY